MHASDWIALASAIATLLGVLVAVVALWMQLAKLNQQLTLQHFADYTKRYQEIVLRFPEDVNEPTFKVVGREDYPPTMRAMRAYFDLCFEEWYLHERKFIDQRIWAVWRGGMSTALSKPAFQQAWELINKDTDFGKSFENFIDCLQRRPQDAGSAQHL
jgi:hypothetical protein